jgi:hypothetical protein
MPAVDRHAEAAGAPRERDAALRRRGEQLRQRLRARLDRKLLPTALADGGVLDRGGGHAEDDVEREREVPGLPRPCHPALDVVLDREGR